MLAICLGTCVSLTTTVASAKVTLYSLKPTGKHLGYIIPVRDGNSLEDEIAEYQNKVKGDPELSRLFSSEQLAQLSIGQVRSVDVVDSTKVLILANRGYDLESAPEGTGKNRVSKFREKLDSNLDLCILPIAIASYLNKEETLEFYQKLNSTFSGVIALGGADIDPGLYHDSPAGARDINLARDRYEIHFLRYWIQHGKGFLYGVCRGHQLISVASGYKLLQHIEDHGDGLWTRHKIIFKTTQAAILQKIFGAQKNSVSVNSYHHQAVLFNPSVNSNIELAATDSQGYVEALSSRDGRIFTTQFHPEFMDGYISKKIFSYLSDKFVSYKKLSCRKLF